MSIFKQTFPDFVQEELKSRQERLGDPINRNALVNYQTSRNAWARMTSGVNVVVNGTPDDGALAKKYVLLGGTLKKTNITVSTPEGSTENTFSQKSGIGSSFDNNAYSNTGATGQKYLRGIRPMPGITNISTSTKAAYGSLIEVVVNFQCWDIRQLEDLELLYMRPGYTILIEWGWAYGGQTPVFYDILNKKDVDFQKVNKDLFDLSKESKGNYEAVLGYVKNYNWKARPDGGYDCTTSIISFGEVLESIKVNYAPYNIDINKSLGLIKEGKYDNTQISSIKGLENVIAVQKKQGVTGSLIDSAPIQNLQNQYSKGILNGLFYELRLLIDQMPDINTLQNTYPTLNIITPNKITRPYNVFKKEFDFKQVINEQQPTAIFGNRRHYITLESLCDLMNDYVLVKSNNATGSLLAEVSTKDRKYVGYTGTLTCLAHPLQVSTDPTKCLINAKYWIENAFSAKQSLEDRVKLNEQIKNESSNIGSSNKVKAFLNSQSTRDFLLAIGDISKSPKLNSSESLIKSLILLRTQIEYLIADPIQKDNSNRIVYNIIGGGNIDNQKATTNGNTLGPLGLNILALTNTNASADVLYESIKSYFSSNLYKNDRSNTTIKVILDKIDISYFTNTNNKITVINALKSGLDFKEFLTIRAQSLEKEVTGKVINDSLKEAAKALEGLKFLKQYFVGNSNGRLGELSNIYVDLEYLMEVASSPNIESRDTQNKNTISLINFFKEILKQIQGCIGNINNFDIHIDKDNIGRIIDINFTDDNNLSSTKEEDKNKVFQIEIHNLNSTIRNYQLESKIFPEQGAIIAISAQAAIPGKLGYNNSTLVAYNRGVVDRLIPQKLSVSDSLASSDLSNTLAKSFVSLLKYFNFLNNSTINNSYAPGEYNNALRDLIGLLSGASDGSSNPNQFKAIIPVMLSFDMDGIGGIIIGNIFKINNDVLPSGYKETVGRKLGFLVKSFNHRIENNDWITTIEAYPVVLEDETNTTTYLIDFFQKALSEYYNSVDPSKVDLANAETISATSSNSIEKFNNNSNIDTAVNFFLSKGYSLEATSAIVGGLLQESSLKPNATNPTGGAFGIAQWLGDRKNQLKSKPNFDSLQTQLNFIVEELNSSEKSVNNRLKSASNLREATAAFAAYERFGIVSDLFKSKQRNINTLTFEDIDGKREMGSRYLYASQIFNKYKR